MKRTDNAKKWIAMELRRYLYYINNIEKLTGKKIIEAEEIFYNNLVAKIEEGLNFKGHFTTYSKVKIDKQGLKYIVPKLKRSRVKRFL